MTKTRLLAGFGIAVAALLLIGATTERAFAAPPNLSNSAPNWQWGSGVSPSPTVTDVSSTPVIAHLFDTNGDGVVNQQDAASLVFISSPLTGGACGATQTCGSGVLRIVDAATGAPQLSLPHIPGSQGFAGISVGIVPGAGPSGSDAIAAVTGSGSLVELTAGPGAPSLSVTAISNQPIPGASTPSFGRGGALTVYVPAGGGAAEVAYGATVFNVGGGHATLSFVGSAGVGGGSPVGSASSFQALQGAGPADLLAGNTAYSLDGTILWQNHAIGDGYDAVGIFTGDGTLDVASVAGGRLSLLDGATGALLLPSILLPGTGAGGAPVIGDFAGDGSLEIGVADSTTFSVFRPDFGDDSLDLVWQDAIQSTSPVITAGVLNEGGGSGAFIAVSDSCFLWIFNGATGAVEAATSHTGFGAAAGPLVTSANGGTELVVGSAGASPSASGCETAGQPLTLNGVMWQASEAVGGQASGLASFFSATPEPSGWVLLASGFGLVGAALRRRRAVLSA